MKLPFKPVLTVALISLAMSHNLSAQEKPNFKERFKYAWVNTWDANQDKQVKIEEFFAGRQARFTLTDENQNGTVDLDEYRNEYENRLDQQISDERKGSVNQTIVRFKAMDKNADEIMSKAEYMKVAKRGFKFYDTNEDNIINAQDEKPKYQRESNKDGLSDAEREEKKLKRKIAMSKRVVRMPTTHKKSGMMTMYDTDGDQQITWQEYMAVRESAFARTDENNNGELNLDEYLAEFENRLDQQIKKVRKNHLSRTDKRFAVLDVDKNNQVTFEEYQLSGVRTFHSYDLDKSGIVTYNEKAKEKVTKLATKSDKKRY